MSDEFWLERCAALAARAEKSESRARDLQAKLADYMRADKALTEAAEKWKARAEQAERERDKADKRALEMCAVQDAEMKARCRAEADNAALLDLGRAIDARRHELLDALYAATNDMPSGRHRDAVIAVWSKPGPGSIPEGPHPGAALLERLRALEKVRKEAKRAHSAMRLISDEDVPPGFDDAQGDLGVALAADALKETP